MLRHVRWINVVVAIALIVVGIITVVVAPFLNSGIVGGAIGGTGLGTLVAEFTTLRERATAAREAERQRTQLRRIEATAAFAPFRSAAEFGAVATQCLFGPAAPSSDAAERFQQLADALHLCSVDLIPPPGPQRELEGYARFKKLKQGLIDRHGESVAGAFAFVYAGGIVTGGSGTVDPELAKKLRNTLAELPDQKLKAHVDRILGRWERHDISTNELRARLQDVYKLLMNYGSEQREILAIERTIRGDR